MINEAENWPRIAKNRQKSATLRAEMAVMGGRATQKRQYTALERKEMVLNLHLAKECRMSDGGMPIVEPCNVSPIPLCWVGFNSCNTADKPQGKGVHFYVDDYQFERLWKSPALYLQRLRRFRCVISPDFSLYVDMPKPMKIWNVYRNRLMAAWWQGVGLEVIPNVSWAEPDSFSYCFDGLPSHSVIAIGSMGANRYRLTRYLWLKGYHAAVELLDPTTIIRYGEKVPGEDESRSVYIDNPITRRLHNGR